MWAQYAFSGLCLGAGFIWPVLWWLAVPGLFLLLTAATWSTNRQLVIGVWVAWYIK